jgi:DNA repair exonuclease SbcCD ATPase subunit
MEDSPMSKTRNAILAALCVGLLAVTAFATSAAAKPGPESGDGSHRGPGPGGNQTADDHKGPRQELRDNRSAERKDRHEAMRGAHDAWQDCKRDFRAANGTLNESMQEHCMAEKSFFLNATHARREARALVGAIAALERRLGRLEERQHLLEDRLAGGNLTGNESAAIQKRIDHIEEEQDRMVDKLQDFRARLAGLQDKWQTVRHDLSERRHHGEDDGLGDDSDDSASDSSSESASESSSESASESSSESASGSASETSSASDSSTSA